MTHAYEGGRKGVRYMTRGLKVWHPSHLEKWKFFGIEVVGKVGALHYGR